ncbi:MAG: phosphocholine cytidylyltransferase family protein [Coriobacteriia bacterium]|nr:phosphocholine cytidylyltransferase family protein [Coriobacteriia bacterium]
MQVVIFNSGIGQRMRELTHDTHKAMAQMIGHHETVFERQVRLLSEAGLTDFVIATGPFPGQIESVFEKPEYENLNPTFVLNPDYATTNYIYSFYLAREYIKGDILCLHGDLVFNRGFLSKIMDASNGSLAAVDRNLELPGKDFKARIQDGFIKEVGVNIFDDDCYAFQPFYLLKADDVQAWLDEVITFVERGDKGVYAENALNGITDRIHIKELSYADDYVAEIDTPEDLMDVSRAIMEYDQAGR